MPVIHINDMNKTIIDNSLSSFLKSQKIHFRKEIGNEQKMKKNGLYILGFHIISIFCAFYDSISVVPTNLWSKDFERFRNMSRASELSSAKAWNPRRMNISIRCQRGWHKHLSIYCIIYRIASTYDRLPSDHFLYPMAIFGQARKCLTDFSIR